jgi:O-antigen/teichoic acid export membrane protein
MTAAVSTVILLAAGRLAEFYAEPRLAPYLCIMAMSILVDVAALLVAALLRRDMAFGKLALINVTGAAVNSAVTITLALLGFSDLSFAWAALAASSTMTCLSLFCAADKSIFRPTLKGWRGLMTFGGYNGLNALLYRVYDSLPSAVLGRILSFDALALYSRAVTICQLPDRAVLRGIDMILLPAFSAEVRGGKGLRDAYLRAMEIMTAILWPALFLLAILADPVVRLLLGGQWLGSVPLVRIMAIASLFSVSAELNYPVLAAMGAMRDILMRGLIAWPLSAVVITCAAFLGLEAAALSWLMTLPFQAYVSIYFVRRHVNVAWADIAAALKKSILVALSAAVGPLAVVAQTGGFDLGYPAAALAVVLAAIGWLMGLMATAHPLFRELVHAARAISARLGYLRSEPQPSHTPTAG